MENAKYEIFFSNDGVGLTTTNANYIANMAKESYESIDRILDSVCFYETSIKLLDSNNGKYVTQHGIDSEILKSYEGLLEKKAQYQSLIAWLREAISAKEEICNNIRKASQEELAEELGIEIPQVPTRIKPYTEGEYLSTWSIKERNEYFFLNTIASAYGKFIHTNGQLKKAKATLNSVISKPIVVEGNGKDTVIKEYTPTVTVEEVEDTFFRLQDIHRGYESRLNGLKHKIETSVEEVNDKREKAYIEEVDKWRGEKESVTLKIEDYRADLLKKARDKKIVIPNNLLDVFNELNTNKKKK